MAIGIYFDGRRLIRPQAVTKIDDSGMYGRGLGGANVLALIGECTGGQPQTPQWFTDPSYAKAILRSGPLLQAIQKAFDPSADVPGAYNVVAIRVNPALQASLILIDSFGDPLVDLTSVDYGQWNNQIKVRIQNGSVLDPLTNKYGKLVTITYGQAFEQGDNIAKKSIFLGLSDPKAITGLYAIGDSGLLASSAATGIRVLLAAVTSYMQRVFYLTEGSTPTPTDETDNAGEGGSTKVPVGLVSGSGVETDSDFLYVGSDQQFKSIYVTQDGTVQSVPSTIKGQYWAGTEWVDLTGFVDGTKGTNIPFSVSGTIYWTIPDDWMINSPTYQPAGYVTDFPSGMFWIRILVDPNASPNASLASGAQIKTITLSRGIGAGLPIPAIVLADYPTIQHLVDYIDSLPHYEAGAITTKPEVDLSVDLDDADSVSLLGGTNTVLTGAYDPVTDLLNIPASNSGYAVGDYIVISRISGSMEEARRVTSVLTSGKITVDSPLSETYASGSKVREANILNSDLQALIDWFNNVSSYMTAAYHSGATVRNNIANISDTYLSGGAECITDSNHPDGVTIQNDWDTAIDLLQTEDTPLISCIAADPAVWAALSAHVSYMSTVGKKERRGFCGGFYSGDNYIDGLGKWNSVVHINSTINAMIAYAMQLNTDRMCYVGPGFTGYDENGILTTYNGAIAAALVAGMAAGVDVAEPLTHKSIKVVGLEYNFKWSDLDRLLEAGVLPLSYDPGHGYRVEQSISTWLRNDKYNRRELSVGRTVDYVARQVRDRLETDFVGTKGTMTTLISIKNATISVLNACYKLGLLAGNAANPPFKNVQVTLDGDTAYVEFEASPVIPINYIPITIHLTVFTTTLTA